MSRAAVLATREARRWLSPVLFGLPRLATSFIQTSLVTLALPLVVVGAVGDARKGVHLGAIGLTAATLSLAALWLAGRTSDRLRLRGGRKSLAVAALVSALPPLLLLGAGASYPAAVVAVLWLVLTRWLCEGTHLPILADELGEQGTGRYSAWIALYQFLGAGCGVLVFAVGDRTAGTTATHAFSRPAWLALVFVSLALAGFPASYSTPPRRDGGPVPPPLPSLVSGPIAWLLAARTLFVAGVLVVSTFLVYIVQDLLGAASAGRTAALMMGTALVGALAAALPAAAAAARVGDRALLFAAGAGIGLAAAGFVAGARLHPLLGPACMLVYGASLAAITSSGLSLVVRLVPQRDGAGRVLAIASGTTLLSQGLASLSGGIVLDPLNRLGPALGPWGLLALVETFLVLGGVCLLHVVEPPPTARNSGRN